MSGCILPYLYITGNPKNGGSGHTLCLGVYNLIFILQVTLRTVVVDTPYVWVYITLSYITGNPKNGGSGHTLCLGVYNLIFI